MCYLFKKNQSLSVKCENLFQAQSEVLSRWGTARTPGTAVCAAHLYGDVQHEARLACVSHAHHPDPVGIAHTHLLWKQRETVSTETPQGKWALSVC